jgi:predicted aldo/keto reductase-like oxidoreductase
MRKKMNNINRRGFIKTGIAGSAGIAFTPSLISQVSTGIDENIICRTLGNTGMKVPVISFGVMRSDNPGLCKAAYEKGIKLFDTANGYQNGNNETMLGNLMKNYPRDSFYMATKVRSAGMTREGLPGPETTADDFLSSFKTSMSRLQMDYVDILYIHDISNPEYLTFKPILNAVKKLKKDGKIRFMGFSTHRNEAEVIDAAASQGEWDVILTSYNFQQTYRKELDAAVHKAAQAGIGIVAMKTLAGGGFLDKEKTKPINTSAAIKWVLSNPDIHTTIPGMTQFDQLDLNLKLLTDITLSDQDRKDLLLASADPGLFCSGCGKCLKECPLHLDIPDLMRAYMYAYGYSSTSQAYDLLRELDYSGNPCSMCDDRDRCRVKCTKGFNVKEKIADITRLINVPHDFLT